MSLSELYDRLYDLQRLPETAQRQWDIADALEAIKQTETGEF